MGDFAKMILRIIHKALTIVKSVGSKVPFQVTIKRPRRISLDTPRYRYQSKLNLFEIRPGAVVIDVGSGQYPFPTATILCDLFLNPTVHRHSPIVRDERPLVVCDVCALPFRNKSADFIYCSHILEHVSDPLAACSELQRVAKAGYIETPNFTKDVLFSWAYGMHRWYTITMNNTLHFFEYTERQAKGIQSSIWKDMILGPTYHPMQDVFYDNQDLFNTIFSWTDSFTCIVHRLCRPSE